MKLCMLTTCHPAFDIRVFHKECVSARQAGIDVVLVVPHERDQVVQGVRIRALPKPSGRFGRMLRTTFQAYQMALAEAADCYHIHDPELLPIGAMLRVQGHSVVYDVHEDLPVQILSKDWIPKFLRRPMSLAASVIEGLLARFMTATVSATPTISEKFANGRNLIVRNYPLLSEFTDQAASRAAESTQTAVYVGCVQLIRGAREMVQAMGQLQGHPRARLSIAGTVDPPNLLESLGSLPGFCRIDYHGWLDRPGVRQLLASAKVGLVVLHPIPNYLDSLPIKLFEYMAAGIPVIASDFPLWRQIVTRSSCGLLVNPAEPTELARALEWVFDHPEEAALMGERGRSAVLAECNWESEATKLISLYDSLRGSV